jgi:GNAT superfamily N-acetyltransferase
MAAEQLRVVTAGDARAFAERAVPFLAGRPVEHSVILTRWGRALGGERTPGPDGDLWWWVERGAGSVAGGGAGGGAVVGVLMQTPPHGAYLSLAAEPVARLLAQQVRRVRPRLAGVGGPGAAATWFADEWHRLGGASARVAMRQGLLVADAVIDPPQVEGRHRLATCDDLDRLRPWGVAFVQEATPGGLMVDHVTHRVAAGLLHVWDVGGTPVSMAAVTPPEAGVSRVQLVYTPPALRRKGFAAACVAATTRRELGQAGRRCMLYTDLANPTSNALYERIGYRRVGEAVDLLFG